ncbi:MAG: redoxin domain-containing protein [Fimbriimonadaceae bacterium]
MHLFLSAALGWMWVSQAPAISVTDIRGKMHQPLAIRAGTLASVLIFVTTECPIANAYAPEINRIIARYKPKGINFYLVNVDAKVSTRDAAKHAKDYGYTSPVLIDRKHQLVRASGARITPEAAIFQGPNLRYLGRIDDQYFGLGRRRARVTQRDLRKALDAIVAHRKPEPARTEAIGCFIPKLQ